MPKRRTEKQELASKVSLAPSNVNRLDREQTAAAPRFGWFATEIGKESFVFLIVCVIAQLATICITWPTWEVRQFPINLPWIPGLPQIPFGILLIASLGMVLIAPRKYGLPIHLLVLLAAVLTDQFRCQPQVISITVMMMACVWKPIRQLCIWYLVSLWLWTGIHKALSPDWFGWVSVDLMKRLNLANPYRYTFAFALLVAVSEIGHALLAVFSRAWQRSPASFCTWVSRCS